MASNFNQSQIDPASGTFGRRNAARYVGGTVAGESHASVKSYLIGFVLSIILTAIPFALVMDQLHYGFSAQTVFAAILVLAVVQVFVHVVYFLHMDRSAEQRWNVLAFSFTVMILGIASLFGVPVGMLELAFAVAAFVTAAELLTSQYPRTARFASVAVGNDDVLYLGGIEAKLFHAVDQHILGVMDTLGVVEDVAVVGGQKPARRTRSPHPVEIIKGLHRLHIGFFAIGVPPWRGRIRPRRPVQRSNADRSDQAIEVRRIVAATGGVLAGRNVSLENGAVLGDKSAVTDYSRG